KVSYTMTTRRRLTVGMLLAVSRIGKLELTQALFGVMPQLAGTGFSCWGGLAGWAGCAGCGGGVAGAGCCGVLGKATQAGVADTEFRMVPMGQEVAPWPSGATTLPLAWLGTTEVDLRPAAEAASFFFWSSGSCW